MTKPRILVVEDNPVVAGMIRHFLNHSDYVTAGIVASGEEALDVAGGCRADLILLDVQLAGEMDGIETAVLLWDRFRVPVVYLTANCDNETIVRATSAEAYGYLHKPFKEHELKSTIEIALYRHAAERNLKQNEKWLETTLRCIADAVIAADSVGCVKLINRAAEALTGWSQQEAVGRDLLEVFQVLECDTRLPAECAVMQLVRDGAPAQVTTERILVSRNGSEAIVEQSAAPIVNDRGDMAGVVLVFRTRKAA